MDNGDGDHDVSWWLIIIRQSKHDGDGHGVQMQILFPINIIIEAVRKILVLSGEFENGLQESIHIQYSSV